MTTFEEFKSQFGTIEDHLNHHYLNGVRPIPSNIAPLDELLCGGFRNGMHVIGGEPAAGKSAFGLFLGMMAALSGTNVMYCTLEMSRSQCIDRCASFWSLETGHPFDGGNTWKYALGAQQKERKAKQQGKTSDYIKEAMKSDPVVIGAYRFADACKGLCIADTETIHDIEGLEQLTEEGAQAGLGMLIIDYLQLINDGSSNDEYGRITRVSRRLAHLGTRFSIPVLALTACNRSSNMQDRPSMHSFKGSGGIEYDAVSASIIAMDEEDASIRRLHVVKNRFGGITSYDTPILFTFDGAHNNFKLL